MPEGVRGVPFQEACFPDTPAGAARKGIEGCGIFDILPVEIQTVGLMLRHHTLNGVQEKPHVFPCRRARRPVGKALKTVEGRRFQRRAAQEVVGAGIDHKPHAEAVQGFSDTGKFFLAPPGDEVEIPVLP